MSNKFGFQSNSTIHAAFWIWKPDPLFDQVSKEVMVNLNDLQYIESNQPAVLMPGITGITISGGILTIIGSSAFKSGMNAALSGLGNATFLNGLIVHVRNATLTQITATMPPISAEISRIQILGNVLTVTANNSFKVGMTVTFSGLVNATFLNDQTVTITGVSQNLSSPSGFASFTTDWSSSPPLNYGTAGCGDGNDSGVAVFNTDGYSMADSGSASDTSSRTVWLYYANTSVSTSERAYILKGTPAQAFINDMEALWTGMGSSQSGGAGASGFVSNGLAGQLAYYAATGTMVRGTPEAWYSNGTITLGGPVSGQLILKGSVSGGVTISEQANAGSWVFTLPTNAGLAGQVLQTDGTGITNWVHVVSGTVTSVSGAGIASGTVTSSGSITVLGSGNTMVAATADANLATAAAGDVLTADGHGNVQDSGVLLSSLATLNSPTFTGTVTLPAGTYAISVSGTATTITGSITYSQISNPPQLAQTFAAIVGSPPSATEYLTGYNATTGLFTASTITAPDLGLATVATSGSYTDLINKPQLAQTFTPILAGSPAEPYEFLTGYTASTGVFTASQIYYANIVGVPAETWAGLTGVLTNGQVIPYTDAGISRLGAASLAIGNGTQGDFSGSLKLTGISIQGALTDGSASVGTSGQVLSSTVTGTKWVAAATGTVTSFSSGNLDSIATAAVATSTTTPALSFSLNTQTANTVWAGPTTGVAAAPTFRALVAADLPAGTGTGSIVYSNSPTIASPTLTGTTSASIIDASSIVTTALDVTGALTDSTGSVGTLGQILESTVTGIKWVNEDSLGAAWATLTGDLTETQVIPWDGAVVGTPDTGISRLGAASVAIGNGTAGDFTGSLVLSNIFPGVACTSFGDSITSGIGATTTAFDYVTLLGNYTGWTMTNDGIGGACIQDVGFIGLMYYQNIVAGSNQNFTLMPGANDMRQNASNATSATNFQLGLEAGMAWLAIPNINKVLAATNGHANAGSPTYAGTWVQKSAYSDAQSFIGAGGGLAYAQSIVPGSTATFSIYGTVVYVGSIIVVGDTATYSITIDGVNQGVFSSNSTFTNSYTGSTCGPVLLRFPNLAEDTHTVVLTVVSASGGNPVYFNWAAGNSGAYNHLGPNVYCGNCIRFTTLGTNGYNNVGGSDVVVAQFNQLIRQACETLAVDGLNIVCIDVSSYYNPNVIGNYDGLHPNNAGYAVIAAAWEQGISGVITPRDRCAANRQLNLSTQTVGWTWENLIPATAAITPPVLGNFVGCPPLTGDGGTITATLALNINVGDFVLLFVHTYGVATVAPTDNAIGGSNTYVQLGSDTVFTSNHLGTWYCASATKAATVVSQTSSQVSLIGSTFQGVSGFGAAHATVYGGAPTAWSDAVTTTANNSVVVSAACLSYATAAATTTGTEKARTGLYVGSNPQVFYPIVLVTTVAPTSGTVVTSAGTSTAQYYGAQVSVELQGVLAHNNPSPTISIEGQVWNGSASVADIWTIQDVIATGTNGASALTFAHTGSSGVAAVEVPQLDIGSTDTGISRLGAASIAIGNGTAGNTTGNLSFNRVSLAGADFAGQATVTTGNTTKAVAFGANYTGAGQPMIVLTPTSDPLALGVPVGYWVTYAGSAGAWTGFTVNIQAALAGNVTFNYLCVGQA